MRGDPVQNATFSKHYGAASYLDELKSIWPRLSFFSV